MGGAKGVEQVSFPTGATDGYLELLIGLEQVVAIVFTKGRRGPIEVGNSLVLVNVVDDYILAVPVAAPAAPPLGGVKSIASPPSTLAMVKLNWLMLAVAPTVGEVAITAPRS